MEELIVDLKNNISSYSFKSINDMVGTLIVHKDNAEEVRTISSLLKADKRKNVSSLGTRIENKVNKYIAEVARVTAMYNFDKGFGPFDIVAGVDEVGRGPLAGPIVSCAVILDLDNMDDIILEINDSKLLSEEKREELSERIKAKAVSYCISELSNEDIDTRGIAYCNNQIFINACNGLSKKPDLVLSDGYSIKNFHEITESGVNKAVVKGDTKSASIACASILAKVYRDNLMKEYGEVYPQYDFGKNVGYGTKTHVEAIKSNGMTPIHRKSFLSNILE